MISGKTNIYGIFGYPVEHTFSPGMHNAAFKKLGLDACYVPFAVHPDRLPEAAKAIGALGLHGLNVTVPHKEKVIPFLDELSQEAKLIGAVNTIQITEGRLIGHNTDGRGFLRSLREQAKFDPRGKTFLFIGSGGAARAVGFSLCLAGAGRIIYYDVDMQKAGILSREITEKTGVEATAIKHDALAGLRICCGLSYQRNSAWIKEGRSAPVGRQSYSRAPPRMRSGIQSPRDAVPEDRTHAEGENTCRHRHAPVSGRNRL